MYRFHGDHSLIRGMDQSVRDRVVGYYRPRQKNLANGLLISALVARVARRPVQNLFIVLGLSTTTMAAHERQSYDPHVDPSRCIRCSLCPEILPEIFRIPHLKGCAVAYDKDGWKPDRADDLEVAAANCSVQAIVLDPDEPVFHEDE